MAMKALARKNRPDIPIETDGLLLFRCERQPNGKKGKEKEDAKAFTHNSN